MTNRPDNPPLLETPEQRSIIGRLIGFCLSNKLVVALVTLGIVGAGIVVAPFDWEIPGVQRFPVPTDAIPDIGENQQIVFTDWPGRTPRDVEDQVTYPLTTALLGVPGVKTVRSYSMFGFSTVYVIFKEDVEFYWSRSRVLEKLSSLPAGTLPAGVQPAIGPDATALGQIFWYTLEGRDPDGRPAGGWDLEELRTVQDWYARYWYLAADGVAEVASVGGFVREYQVDVDPDALRAYGVTIDDVYRAVRASNIDVGARTVEINRVEYFIRGVGFIKAARDIAESVVAVRDNVPVLVRNVATVSLGPAQRRGALDKDGAQAVGGVVVARYGSNPLATIRNVKRKIADTAEALPSKAIIDFRLTGDAQVRSFAAAHGFAPYDPNGGATGHLLNQSGWKGYLRTAPRGDWPAWLTLSKVAVVPFYDRTELIHETLGTLNDAIFLEVLVTALVVLVMVMHLRSSVLIGATMPLTVLLCFVGMKLFGVDANIVALSGIAIAVGTIVDMGIVICENTLRHLAAAAPGERRLRVVHRAASEVGSAVLTAAATTIVGFLPVFTMTGPEGKLFKPLAYTKTFALLASILIALTILPVGAMVLFRNRRAERRNSRAGHFSDRFSWLSSILVALGVAFVLTRFWEPLGPQRGIVRNFLFVGALVGGLLGLFELFRLAYPHLLAAFLRFKLPFLAFPAALVVFGACVWLGFGSVFDFVPRLAGRAGIDPNAVRSTAFWVGASHKLPGLGREFMPPLEEGSYLFMPTTMVHASIGEVLDILSTQDRAFEAIPEIESAVGKLGRADTPLDPAPISMIETIINYKSQYLTDKDGRRVTFRHEPDAVDVFRDEAGRPLPAPDGKPYYVRGRFSRDRDGRLVPDGGGMPFRQWRPALEAELNGGRAAWGGVNSPNDIWELIVSAARIPGTTSAPRLQPIAARIVMLQSGMRAPMGVKVRGPSLDAIENVGIQIEKFLKQVPGVEASAVVADRIVGKPYIEIVPDRAALARYGVPVAAFQDVVETAIGGERITTTVEGRERFPVRVRYARELRDDFEKLGRILVPGSEMVQVPVNQLARIRYVRGPQEIKSEDTFLVSYVLFDRKPESAEVDVVEACQQHLQSKIKSGELVLPHGVSYVFAGTYANQLHAQRTLALVLPGALLVVFLLIYFQFRSTAVTALVFTGVFVAASGGFLLIWLYGRPWFLDFSLFGANMRDLFQVHPINLSVAVWVGFLALFGIATDDGVIMATYMAQMFRDKPPRTVADVRRTVVAAGRRRVRPCLMTTATTVLALLPVLSSTGRGSDIMVPMAIPSFGGMTIEVLTMFVVPVLYCWLQERKLRSGTGAPPAGNQAPQSAAP